MFSLKDHPFAVETFFDRSLVFTFAVPRKELESRIPPCLTLDTWKEEWAFVAVAIVKTEKLRPRGFPKFMGNDFTLVGFRIFVRYTDQRGRRLRGLYILKSETDNTRMTFLGNIFTHYRYQTTDIRLEAAEDLIKIRSAKSDIDIVANVSDPEPALPSGSPFQSWKEARRFAGPLPFTFTYNEASGEVLIIEGVREHWEPRPVSVRQIRVGFLENLGLKQAVLANAFLVSQVPYHWKKGKKEKWKA